MIKTFTKFPKNHCTRYFSTTLNEGAGPAGFHMAKQILKDIPNSYVDIFDSLPFPFGLVRYGVAPDHQEVKKITKDFTQGKDLHIDEIKGKYTGIVFTYGAQSDKKLGLEGEDTLKGIYSARTIVNWYNSHPNFLDLSERLGKDHDMKNMIIIGNGNVAVDVARIFAKSVEELRPTDINNDTLELKMRKQTENIIMVGRRGFIQAAFTTKELRGLTSIKDVEYYLVKEELESSMNEQSLIELQGDRDKIDIRVRANKRKLEIIKKLPVLKNSEELRQLLDTKPKGRRMIFRFLMSPIQLIGHEGRISEVVFQKNYLQGGMFGQKCLPDPKKPNEVLKCDVFLRSIGYNAHPLPGVLFDQGSSVIPTSHGCVLSEAHKEQIEVGLYAAGWIKTGPIGVLDTTLKDSVETFINIKNHFLKGFLQPKFDPFLYIDAILKERGVRYSTFKDWEKVDYYEKQAGDAIGKVREKVRTTEEFFKVASAEH